jgi:hypothetical protein
MHLQFVIGILYGGIKNDGSLTVGLSSLVENFVDGKKNCGQC